MAARTETITFFEYKTLDETYTFNDDGTLNTTSRYPLRILTLLGRQGWELVSTEMIDEHISRMGVAPDEVVDENGDIDYVDTGRRELYEYNQKRCLMFFKRAVNIKLGCKEEQYWICCKSKSGEKRRRLVTGFSLEINGKKFYCSDRELNKDTRVTDAFSGMLIGTYETFLEKRDQLKDFSFTSVMKLLEVELEQGREE